MSVCAWFALTASCTSPTCKPMLSTAVLTDSRMRSILAFVSTASLLFPSNLPERGFHSLGYRTVYRRIVPLSYWGWCVPWWVLSPACPGCPFWGRATPWICLLSYASKFLGAKLYILRASPAVQNMPEYVCFSQSLEISYRLPCFHQVLPVTKRSNRGNT